MAERGLDDRAADTSPRCAGCGHPGSHTVYLFPGSGREARLCTPCVSPLCELCGWNSATWNCGSTNDNYHVCDACLSAPEVRRKKAKPLRKAVARG